MTGNNTTGNATGNTSRTMTQTRTTTGTLTLRLRGAEAVGGGDLVGDLQRDGDGQIGNGESRGNGRNGTGRGIRWAADVVDNEGLGRKSSKGTVVLFLLFNS